MKKQLTTALIWVFSFIFMLMLAVYQRMTGPTHPLRGKVELNGETYKYKFLRSHDTGIDAPLKWKCLKGL